MVVREKESGQHSCWVLYFPPRERESIPPGRSIFNHDVAGMWRVLNVDIIGRLRPSDEHRPRRQQEIGFQHLHLAVRSNTSGPHVRGWRGNVTRPGCCGLSSLSSPQSFPALTVISRSPVPPLSPVAADCFPDVRPVTRRHSPSLCIRICPGRHQCQSPPRHLVDGQRRRHYWPSTFFSRIVPTETQRLDVFLGLLHP